MISRIEVESLGTSGASYEEKEDYFLCKTLNSFYLCADKDDHGYTPHAKKDGYWEPWITAWMINNVKPGSRVLDIGANHGYYSLMLADYGCMVDAYEPQPKLARLIRRSADINNFAYLRVYEEAISDSKGKAVFTVPIHHGMNATLSSTKSYDPYGSEEIVVNTISIDELDKTYDFIKIDAEGGEINIWRGMQKYLEKNPNTLILIEWRWDRYDAPAEFGSEIFDRFSVTNVDFDGNEIAMNSSDELKSRKHEDWMLVLRAKNA